MLEDTETSAPLEENLEAATEERLAGLLRELGARRNALREELGILERSIEELEVELARRGAGG